MNKNQKLLAGGISLAVIVVIVAGVIAYTTYNRRSSKAIGMSGNNSNITEARNSPLEAKSPESSFQYDDERHRLFQAAGATEDRAVIREVLKKTGFMKSDGAIATDYQKFIEEHFRWALKNAQFVNSVSTRNDAREYVRKHIEIQVAPTKAP